jgi:multidrug efflux pump subunit AcrA (membrane-fusion protein)
MSTEQDQAREIAERIARRVSAESSPSIRPQQTGEVSSELAAVRAGLSELQRKISQLEARISVAPSNSATNLSLSNPARTTPTTHSPWLAGINSSYSHPSQEKFGVEEATVAELVDFFEKEKICSVEPGGKPCDHCAMCSSRGF